MQCINHKELNNVLHYTIDKMERMESGYLCEVLHYLLQKRLGVPLVKTTVDLVDKDNEASLDLMCALLKHCKSYLANMALFHN